MLQSIIELANDGILVFDERFGIAYANPTISQITGYPPARIAEMTVTDLLGAESRSLLEETLSHPERRGEKACRAIRFQTASGEIRDAEICIVLAPPPTTPGSMPTSAISPTRGASERNCGMPTNFSGI